jgi:ketosteroid isomerase-like protein
VGREEQIAILERAYALWAEGDFERVLELATDDIEWIPPSYALEPKPLRGHDEVRRGIGSYFESFDLFVPEPEEIIPGAREDEYVVLVRTHTRGRGSGAEVEMQVAHLIRLRGGRVARFEVVPDRAEALERAGVERRDSRSP